MPRSHLENTYNVFLLFWNTIINLLFWNTERQSIAKEKAESPKTYHTADFYDDVYINQEIVWHSTIN